MDKYNQVVVTLIGDGRKAAPCANVSNLNNFDPYIFVLLRAMYIRQIKQIHYSKVYFIFVVATL